MRIRYSSFIMMTALCVAVCSAPGEDFNPWRDPSFRKQFLGTYAARMETEPRPSSVEQELLEKIAPLMATDEGMKKARELLIKNSSSGSTAVYDFTIGNIYFQFNEPETAVKWYRRAVEKFPSFLRAHKNLGLYYVQNGAFEDGVASLTRAIELGARDGMTMGLLGYACSMIGQFTAAESAYREAMMLQPHMLDWKLGLAKCLFRQWEYERAAVLCGELIEKDPMKPDYWILQANAYLGMKKPMKAAENYEYLFAANRATPAALNTLGDIYVNEGLMDLARGAYARALDAEEEPDLGRYLRNAEVLAARGAHHEAEHLIARFEPRIRQLQDTALRKRLLKLQARLAAARGAGDEEQAALLEDMVRLDPMDGEALILLARHHAERDRLEKACFYFERAEQLEEHEALACLRHGQALVKNGRYREAVPLLKRSMELQPREELERYLEQIERLARAQEG